MKKKGFTLAEIMVALSLVAGLAMLLTPTLIADNQRKFLYTALDRVNTDMVQLGETINLMQARGEISTSGMSALAADSPVWETLKTLPDAKVRLPNGYPIARNNLHVLRSGVFIFVDNDNSQIIVDVNGRKSPNVIGQDIYYFVFRNNEIVPKTGCADDNIAECNASRFLEQGRMD